MLSFVKKILVFSGCYSKRLKLSFVLSFFENLLVNVPIFVAWYFFVNVLEDTLSMKIVWQCFFYMLAALFLRFVLRWIFVYLESGTGYEICLEKRVEIGDLFKRFPMSYFSEGNLGNVTSVITVDLTFIEEHGMSALDQVINAYIASVIGLGIFLYIDWRLALIGLITMLVGFWILRKIDKESQIQSYHRQKQQSRLVAAVLEYVKGIAVIKAFNMTGNKASEIQEAILTTRNHAIEFEEKGSLPVFFYKVCFAVGTAGLVLVSIWLYQTEIIDLSKLLMVSLFVFVLYRPLESLGALSAQIRVMEAGLNRYEALEKVEIIDQQGEMLPLTDYTVDFKKVSFAYDREQVLEDISFHIPEKSMTALVGASGSGKTTVTNLLMRFWDVEEGSIEVGGVEIKKLTCDYLLTYMSAVFQKVYLFDDTIINNIRIGRPDATLEEVYDAAKRARCHDFIRGLENGYDTVVGEGGGRLSGGERQRISLARAILKDSPIILLDEATASVDPDNEHLIREAINELVKEKTVLVIAHHLATIRNADQILVFDQGKIVQRGVHEALICQQDGKYASLWRHREKAAGWQIMGNE